MKRIWNTIVACCLLMLASCDPGYDEDLCIKNTSERSVTVIPANRVGYSRADSATYVHEATPVTLASGEEQTVYTTGGVGAASRGEGEFMFKQYYNDSVVFQFDDGEQVVYYSGDTSEISPYNFNSTLYGYEEKLNTGITFHGLPYYGRLTFTITNAHYAAAQKFGD